MRRKSSSPAWCALRTASASARRWKQRPPPTGHSWPRFKLSRTCRTTIGLTTRPRGDGNAASAGLLATTVPPAPRGSRRKRTCRPWGPRLAMALRRLLQQQAPPLDAARFATRTAASRPAAGAAYYISAVVIVLVPVPAIAVVRVCAVQTWTLSAPLSGLEKL